MTEETPTCTAVLDWYQDAGDSSYPCVLAAGHDGMHVDQDDDRWNVTGLSSQRFYPYVDGDTRHLGPGITGSLSDPGTITVYGETFVRPWSVQPACGAYSGTLPDPQLTCTRRKGHSGHHLDDAANALWASTHAPERVTQSPRVLPQDTEPDTAAEPFTPTGNALRALEERLTELENKAQMRY